MNNQERNGFRQYLLVFACSMLFACSSMEPRATGASPDKGFSAERLNRLTSFMQAKVDAGQLPGTVMVIAHRGKVVYSKALGARDPKSGAPMTEDAIFRMYSMTKPVVSVAALILLEEGKLQLGDPVSTYIPELKDLKVRTDKTNADGSPVLVAAERQMTILDLMRHAAGLIYNNGEGTPLERQYHSTFASVTGSDDFIKKLATLPLDHQPATKWHYSMTHDVLGVVVERVSRKPLPEFLAERIFVPLKMVDTAFWVEPSKVHRLAQPYALDPDTKRPINLVDATKMSPMAAGGGSGRLGNGINSTARDYLRFAEMLRNGGELDGARIISRKSVELLAADQVKGLAGNLSAGHGWGLGVLVRIQHSGAIQHGSIGDYGWGGAGGTSFFIDPAEQITAVRMSQAPGPRGSHNRSFRNLIYSALE